MNAENSAVEDLITNTEEFIQNNPRSLGYISHAETMKSIKNLKKFGKWQILDKDETVRHFRQISNAFKINVRSLRDWHLQLKKNPNWLTNHAKTEFGHVFTDKQLENLAHIVNRICDSQNVIITNQLMKNLSIAYYKSLNFHPQSGLKFNASSHFLSFFKKKSRFSTRRLHQKRRPSAPRVSVSNFLKRSKKIFKKADHSHIVNSDESFWRCEEYHLRTWAPTNSQSIILHTNNSEKSGFTALATIGLDGQKYPLILIAKGKTIAVESNWFAV